MTQETEKLMKEIKEEFKRHTDILLEKFEDQVKVVAEGFEILSGKIDHLTTRVDKVETRLDGVETRLDGVETRLDGVETRLDRVETNIEIIKTDIEFIKNGLKRKVDAEEFEALERRVALLEARTR